MSDATEEQVSVLERLVQCLWRRQRRRPAQAGLELPPSLEEFASLPTDEFAELERLVG